MAIFLRYGYAVLTASFQGHREWVLTVAAVMRSDCPAGSLWPISRIYKAVQCALWLRLRGSIN